METLLYIGKVSLYWALLFACYQLVLRKHTFFVWNRFFLLGSLLVSFALPLVIYPETAPEVPATYVFTMEEFSTVAAPIKASIWTWANMIWMIYGLGVAYMSYRLVKQLAHLKQILQSGETIEVEEYQVVMLADNSVGSFSFLKHIVINRNDYEYHFDEILSHEMVHARQKHSIDILLIELLRIVFWFNPFLILYKKSVQEVHEFLADEAASNRQQYANFLVAYSLNAPFASLTNHFFKSSQIKSRIVMIYKNRTSKWMLSSYFGVFMVISLIALFVAGCEHINENTTIKSNGNGELVTVKGIVTDQNGDPLPGVDISAQNFEIGTSSDIDGRYTISLPDTSRLIFSFPGQQTQVVHVKAGSNISVKLGPHSSQFSYGAKGIGTKREASLKNDITEKLKGKKIFTVVENQPKFPGGVKEMYRFIGNNIKYPEAAVRANVEGRVFIAFVVTESGEITNIEVLKGLGFGMDEEAIRVVKAFPNWTPGSQDGKSVNTRYNLPINFQLQETKPEAKKSAKTKSTTEQPYFAAKLAPSLTSGTDITVGANAENYSYVKNIKVPATEFKAVQKTRQMDHDTTIKLDNKANNALIVIDGKIQLQRGDLAFKSLIPNDIQSISILKGEKATMEFGELGKDGVIAIVMKK